LERASFSTPVSLRVFTFNFSTPFRFLNCEKLHRKVSKVATLVAFEIAFGLVLGGYTCTGPAKFDQIKVNALIKYSKESLVVLRHL